MHITDLGTLTKPQHISMAIYYLSGASLEEVGRLHGITRERVRQILAKGGVRRLPRGHHPRKGHLRDGIDPYSMDPFIRDFAVILDDWSLARIARALGVRYRYPRARTGKKRTHKRNLLGKCEQAISLWNAGMSLKEIAARLDSPVGSVGTILNRARKRGEHVRWAYSSERREKMKAKSVT